MTNAGLYIHIPFCRSRCSYCDFATGAFEAGRAARYVAALIKEIGDFPRHAPFITRVHEADTIYFGGGTPSLLSPSQIESILAALHHRFKIHKEAEVTLEINPGTLDKNTARDLLARGVTRASFGAQTFDDEALRRLGRVHNAMDVRRTFDALRDAGFTNVSFDLIAGLPEQTHDDWHDNLRQAIALCPEHLSLYLLEVHHATPLAAQLKAGRWTLPDDDATAAMYRALVYEMTNAGYEHYEISNFCLPGFASRHNTKYWTRAPVYGFGCAAHSFDGNRTRWANERDTARYVELIESGESSVNEVTELNDDDTRAEHIFLGLRLMNGISLPEHQSRFGVDLEQAHPDDLTRLRDAGLIEINNQQLKLTSTGALLSNEVFAALA